MKRFKQALTFGRFNLLHKGHIDLFRQMYQSADDILIGVSSSPKNLLYKERSKVIQKALEADPEVGTFEILPKRTPFGMFEVVMYPPEQTVVYLGHDQYELGQTLSREFGVAIITIPRLTSSTEVRALIDNDQWTDLARVVPASIINDVVLLRNRELNQCQNSH